MEVLRVTFLSSLVLELVGTISTAIVAVQIGLRILYLGMDFEQAFFILLLAPEFYFPLRQLGLRFHAAASGVTASRRIFEILERPEQQSTRRQCRTASPKYFDKVIFDRVGFRYDARRGEKNPSCNGVTGIDLTLNKGERVVLIGSSGAGKTTISYLLLRFLDPQQGNIFIDQIPLASIPAELWRSRVSWVPQKPYLFSGTLAENILLGRPGATSTDLHNAAKQACLDGWIAALPSGYETRVGEGGIGISGGQSQRIAIARAILKDAPLVILDEPTSHLDSDLESQIEPIISCMCMDRIVLSIAHRRSTIFNNDRIYVMDHGQIVHSGTHSELLVQSDLYLRLVNSSKGTV
jgi:ATP-binding cassette subfamily C protein CydD